MRFVIVSREAATKVGLYLTKIAPSLAAEIRKEQSIARILRIPFEEQVAFREKILEKFNRTPSVAPPKVTSVSDALVLALRTLSEEPWDARLLEEFKKRPPISAEAIESVQRLKVTEFLGHAFDAGRLDVVREELSAQDSPNLLREGECLLRPPDPTWVTLPLEMHCVTISLKASPVGSEPIGRDHPLLLGQINGDEQLGAIENADGGYSRIHVFNLRVAREVLKRHGDGVVEEGCYLLHPKRENVLVPVRTYHMDMLQEMAREARVVMGRLGAKRMKLETLAGVSFSGGIVAGGPLKQASLTADATLRDEHRLNYEWGSSTYDADDVLKNCVWIQDNAGIMTIVDQRRTSNLTKYEEISQVDTSFKVSLGFMRVFDAKFSWAETSTYRYSVDFFDRLSR
jgi:hypothetical protein